MRADHALLLLDALPNCARGFAAETLGPLRMRKDAAEIALLRDNARIADLAQSAERQAIRPGITEAALADIAAATFRAHGASPEFTILGTGDHSAFPHARLSILAPVGSSCPTIRYSACGQGERPDRRPLPHPGLTIRREWLPNGWRLVFTGPEAKGMMMESVMAEIERMYGAG